MGRVYKQLSSVSQTTGGNYAEFQDLTSLSQGKLSRTDTIKGRDSTPNRPSTLSFTNFGFEIPNGADIKKIIINYEDEVSNINIPAKIDK